MEEKKYYCVYIATNYPRKTVLYTGVTNSILTRDDQHKSKISKNSFTAKYNVNRIVYYEAYKYVNDAIAREKEIKGWKRVKKLKLINNENPEWLDLVEESW